MAKFEIQSPDGQKYELETPGDSQPTPEIIAKAKASMAPASEPSIFTEANLPTEQTPAQQPVQSGGNQLIDAFGGAGIEMARGFQQGGAGLLRSADAGADLLAKMAGNPELSSGTFGQMADQIQAGAEAMPQTNLSPGIKKAYNLVGELPGLAAEFVATKRAISPFMRSFGKLPGKGEIGDIVASGIQGAVAEYKKTPEYGALLEGFQQGSTLGAMFNLAPKAIEIAKLAGKDASKAFIKSVTGSEETAKAFVENPWRFNLNPFGKVKSLSELTESNRIKMDDLKDSTSDMIANERMKIADRKALISSEQDRNFFAVKQKNRDLVNAVQQNKKIDVENVAKSASEAHAKTIDSVNAGLLDDFTNSVNKLEIIKKAEGEQVGQAIENITNKDPFSRILPEPYLNKFKEVANKNGYDIVENRVVPKFGQGSANPEVQNLLQSNLDDVFQVVNNEGIPLGFAQGKKKMLQQSGYSGSGEVANVQKQLSGALNPATMDDAIIGSNIKEELRALRDSNKNFSELVPKYKEAIANYSRIDASGKSVPDFNRALNAIARNDKVVIRQLMKADSALPVEDRLLPKLYEANRRIGQANTVQLANVKLAKRKANEAVSKLREEIRDKEFKLRAAQRGEKLGEARDLQLKLNELRKNVNSGLKNTLDFLKKEEDFLSQQNSLRSFFGKGRAGNMQSAGLLGMSTQMLGPNPFGGVSAALTLAPSPMIGANVIKQGQRVVNPALNAISDLIKRTQSVTQKI